MMNFSKKTQKGQTLIEVLIAIGIGVIITGSLVSLGNSSTRRASQARQASEATKLALQGIEIVRNIRDSQIDGGASITGCFGCNWNELYGTSFGNSGAPKRLRWDLGGSCNNQWCLRNGSEGGLLGGVFTRRVFVRDNSTGAGLTPCGTTQPLPPVGPFDSNDLKRVHVVVSWDSPIGVQEREVVTCFSPKR